MNVDEARGHRAARRVDLYVSAQVRADLADDAVGNCDVSDASRRARAVVDRPTLENQVSNVHRYLTRSRLMLPLTVDRNRSTGPVSSNRSTRSQSSRNSTSISTRAK